jgi:ElaB/YqjD/DUF883 family membrane-anchored ribosome-binding protein
MAEATGNGLETPNTAMAKGNYGRELSMSEFSETAQDYGRKIADAAARAGDFVNEKVNVVGDKIKNLQGKDFNEIAGEARDYARQNPGQAILLSAVAGVFLGFLLRGGRR